MASLKIEDDLHLDLRTKTPSITFALYKPQPVVGLHTTACAWVANRRVMFQPLSQKWPGVRQCGLRPDKKGSDRLPKLTQADHRNLPPLVAWIQFQCHGSRSRGFLKHAKHYAKALDGVFFGPQFVCVIDQIGVIDQGCLYTAKFPVS